MVSFVIRSQGEIFIYLYTREISKRTISRPWTRWKENKPTIRLHFSISDHEYRKQITLPVLSSTTDDPIKSLHETRVKHPQKEKHSFTVLTTMNEQATTVNIHFSLYKDQHVRRQQMINECTGKFEKICHGTDFLSVTRVMTPQKSTHLRKLSAKHYGSTHRQSHKGGGREFEKIEFFSLHSGVWEQRKQSSTIFKFLESPEL